ncbi:hypothetical protein [Haloferula sargassicola]|uniref:Helicase XPB/Ssl2 N-terminal domain-containing protein n=1 Tax=Haloferula sargassicola TaxID=490096 RepID=A0ABP9UKT0_9BACT
MPTLHDTLWNQTVDELRYRLKFLAPASKATKKADFIDRIKAELSGPGLAMAMDQLDETSRLAVIEAVHNPGLFHDAPRFSAKYGRDAVFFTVPEKPGFSSRYQTPQNSTRLNLFFYYDGPSRSRVVPSDLAAALRPLVPAPAAVTVPCIPEPVATEDRWVRHTEGEALSELGAMLRLAATGKLGFGGKTGMPSKNSLAAIETALTSGDWFPPERVHIPNPQPWDQEIGPIKPVGWTRMLYAAGLVSIGGSKSLLTPQGRKAVAKPAGEVIAAIWRKWIANRDYDEFNRIDVIKGQSVKGSLTARAPRRSAVLEALGKCPTGEWIPFDGFSRYMRAAGILFEVSNDPWKLYIADREYGALGYDGFGGWDVLQNRYLMCFLMEHAATLGLVDIAYGIPDHARPVDNWGMDDYLWLSRYDGLEAFRINPLGEHVLSGGNTAFHPTRPAAQVRLTVLGNRTIRVASGSLSPTERLQLETWAQPEGDDAFRLDDSRALDAVESGQDPDGFTKFLEERDDQPLPETTLAFLIQARENGDAVRQSGGAILFECRDARTADLISRSKDLEKLCLRAGETTLAVREEDLGMFRRQVRLLGLGIKC